jgi:hypothetical protein
MESGAPIAVSRSSALRFPRPEDAVECGNGLLEAFLVFVVEVADLAGESARGIGDLVAGAEHLGVESLEGCAAG